MKRLNCRARVSKSCYHGKVVVDIHGDPDGDQEDGTWDGHSVICDACYIVIGQPSVPVKDGRRRLEVVDAALTECKAQHGWKP